MMKRYFLIIPAVILLFVSCTKDRDVEVIPVDTTNNPADTVLIGAGVIKINEFVAKGSANINEFGKATDWFEIYNTQDTAVLLKAGCWFVTDNLSSAEKYELPELTLPAYGFLVIWCDTMDTVATQIHTGFGLNAGGEEIGIFYKSGNNDIAIDLYVYPAILYSGYSFGRSPDGSDTWVYFPVPTPGASNQ